MVLTAALTAVRSVGYVIAARLTLLICCVEIVPRRTLNTVFWEGAFTKQAILRTCAMTKVWVFLICYVIAIWEFHTRK